MYKTLLPLLLILSFPLLAQDFDNYQLLRNQGPIPASFTTPSSKKYEAEILNMDKELKAREQKDQKQFYLETNFVIDDLLKSGKVLFGTEVIEYVNKVGNKVLEAVPELKDKVEFYVLRSSAVNAFATNQGIVFINMGLLAQLENEAQLAFIIAHELTHVQKQHSLNKFLNKKDINRNISRKRLLQSSDFDEALVATNSYSKELEFEADKGGLDIYLKTDYSLEEIKGVFDVLRYAHLLFDVEEFDKTYFNIGSLILPDYLFLDSTQTIKAIDDDIDEEEIIENRLVVTHPSTNERENLINETIKSKDNSQRKSFLISQDQFQKVRKIARYELVYYYLHNFRFEDAIYAIFLLQKEDPDSKFLQKSLVKALHAMTKFRNNIAKGKSDPDYQWESSLYEKIESPLQQLYYFSQAIDNKGLTLLALRHAWAAHEQYPEDQEIKALKEDLFYELAYHYSNLNDFLVADKEETLMAYQSNLKKFKSVPKPKLKYKNSKYQVKYYEDEVALTRYKALEVFNFQDYSLGDIIKNSITKKLFNEGLEKLKVEQEKKNYYKTKEGQRAWKKQQKRIKRKGLQLDIDSVLVVAPYYLKLDARKSNAYKFLETEEGQKKFNDILAENATKTGLHTVILNPNDLDKNNTEEFNEIQILNEWFSQQTRIGEWYMPGFEQGQVNAIAEKYGTPYILKTGVVTLRAKKDGPTKTASIILLFTPQTLPFGVYLLAKPNYFTLYYSILYDLKKQKYQVIHYQVMKKRDRIALLNAYTYDTFFQINASK